MPEQELQESDLELNLEIDQMINDAEKNVEIAPKKPKNPVLSSAGYITAMKRNNEKKAAAEEKKKENREKRLINAQKNFEAAKKRLNSMQGKSV